MAYTDHEPEEKALREAFERLVGNHDSYGLKRSRRGTYTNPAISRDWKWFQLGAAAAEAQFHGNVDQLAKAVATLHSSVVTLDQVTRGE